MHLARREGFDSLTTNELLLADCHSYMDNRSATKAPHLEQLPLWKTRNMEMRLWINPPTSSNNGRQRHTSTYSLVTDEVLHPISKVQPLLIGLNLPDQVESTAIQFPSRGSLWQLHKLTPEQHAPSLQPSPRRGYPSRGSSGPPLQKHRWTDR